MASIETCVDVNDTLLREGNKGEMATFAYSNLQCTRTL